MQRYVKCGDFKCKVETLDLMINRHLPTSPAVLRQKFVQKIAEIYGHGRVAHLEDMMSELGVGEILIMFGEIHDEELEG